MNSRYYDSNVGRFINADKYLCSGNHLNAFNCFSYCWDNPVNLKDSDGYKPEGNIGVTLFEIPIWSYSANVWNSGPRMPIELFPSEGFWDIGATFKSIPSIMKNIFTAKALSVKVDFNIAIKDNGLSIIQAEALVFELRAYTSANNNSEYLYLQLLKAELDIGLNEDIIGFDGGLYLGEVGVSSEYIDASIKFGVGLTLDFSHGIKFGAALGWGFEIDIKLW